MKLFKRLVIIFLIGFIGVNTVDASNISWVKHIGGTGNCGITDPVTDSLGNVYVGVTLFNGSISLNGVDSIYTTGTKIFIVKYNQQGSLVWYREFESYYSPIYYSTIGISSICLNKNSRLIITGRYTCDTLFMDSLFLPHLGTDTDDYIASFDTSDGSIFWLRRIWGNSFEHSLDVCADRNGNIAIAGYFDDNIHFDTISFTAVTDDLDSYFCKLDSNGNFLWAKHFYSPGGDHGRKVLFDHNGDLIIAGAFGWTCDGNTQDFYIDTFVLASTYPWATFFDQDAYIAKISGVDGSPIWVNSVQGWGWQEIRSLKIGKNSLIDIAGVCEYTTTIDTGSFVSNGETDSYWAQFNSDGSLVSVNNGGSQYGMSMAFDLEYASLTLVNNDYRLVMAILPYSGDYYSQTYNPNNGNILWMILTDDHQLIKAWQSNGTDMEVAFDGNMGIYATGCFHTPITLGSLQFTPVDEFDAFLAYYDNHLNIGTTTKSNLNLKVWHDNEANVIRISADDQISNIELSLLDLTGKSIVNESGYNNTDFSVKVPNISSGIYLLNCKVDGEYFFTEKVFISQ